MSYSLASSPPPSTSVLSSDASLPSLPSPSSTTKNAFPFLELCSSAWFSSFWQQQSAAALSQLFLSYNIANEQVEDGRGEKKESQVSFASAESLAQSDARLRLSPALPSVSSSSSSLPHRRPRQSRSQASSSSSKHVQCRVCEKTFTRPWLLQNHLRVHTGEKPYRCPICSKAFADKSNLRAHIQTHSGEKPFRCGRCDKAFALKAYLSKHEESACLRQQLDRHSY